MNTENRQAITYGISSVLGVLIVVMIIVNISVTMNLRREIIDSAVQANATLEVNGTEETKLYYTLTSGDGVIIIKDKNGAKVDTFECDIEYLPSDDRERLKSGIRVNTEAELAEVIENFSN